MPVRGWFDHERMACWAPGTIRKEGPMRKQRFFGSLGSWRVGVAGGFPAPAI